MGKGRKKVCIIVSGENGGKSAKPPAQRPPTSTGHMMNLQRCALTIDFSAWL